MITDSARRLETKPRSLDSLPLPVLHHISGYLSLLEPPPLPSRGRSCDCGACVHSDTLSEESKCPRISPGLARFSLINKGLRSRVWPDMVKILIVHGDEGARKVMESLSAGGAALIKTACIRIYLRDRKALPTPSHINALLTLLSPHIQKLQIDMVECPYPADHLTDHPELGWWGKGGSHLWKCGSVLPKPFKEGGDGWHRIKVELPCLMGQQNGRNGNGDDAAKGMSGDQSKDAALMNQGITWPKLTELTIRSTHEDERRLDEEYFGDLIGLATIVAGSPDLERLRLTGQFLECEEACQILRQVPIGEDGGNKLTHLELDLRGGGKQSVRRELLWTALGARFSDEKSQEKGRAAQTKTMKLPETSQMQALVLELVPGLIKLRDQDWITLDQVLRRHTNLCAFELPIGFSTAKDPGDDEDWLTGCLKSLVGQDTHSEITSVFPVSEDPAQTEQKQTLAPVGKVAEHEKQWGPLQKLVKVDIKYGSQLAAEELSHQGCQSTGLRVDCWKAEHQDNLSAVVKRDSNGGNSRVLTRFSRFGQGIIQKYARYKTDGDVIPTGPDGGVRDSVWPRDSPFLDLIPRHMAEMSYAMGHMCEDCEARAGPQ